MNRDEIFNKLKACVDEVLLVEEEELIQPDSDLVHDLGAESIDFVEILHMLAKVFDVETASDTIYPGRDFFTEKKYLKTDQNIITPLGIEILINNYPHLDKDNITDYQKLTQYLNSISLLMDYLEFKLTQ